ncbi:helix-turn-helix transcriptional regulator, partial [Streptomyces sp. SID4985]|uniref:helix-turn-helix domain-containing protein n=1 Tax=Streptomyces sp. SID4985 TaxID=2690292 RepID=UPI00136EC6D9
DRGRRLYLAASSAWLGAHPSRASALAHAAAAHVTDPLLRTHLTALRGQIEWNTRSLHDGHDLVLRAAGYAADVDAALTARLAMLAASLAAFGARSPYPVDPAALVTEPKPDSPPWARATWALLHGFGAVTRGDWARAAEFVRCAFALTDADPVDDPLLQASLGIAAMLTDDDERGLRLHERQLTAARRAGALDMVAHALTRGVTFQIATGAWSQATSAASEALPLTAGTGHPGLTALPTAQLALVAALRGDDDADRRLDRVTEIRDKHPVGITDGLAADLTHWARGLRAAAHPPTALHHFERIEGAAWRRLTALDLFDAAVRADRPGILRGRLAELERFAAGTGLPAATAVVEHGRALLAGAGTAESHFRRALAAHADSPRRPDRARTHLAFGEYLRRARRRVDAREHLRTALTLFEDLGATPWAERAARELRASGETSRRRTATTTTELTPQERQVAALVRQGLSNRDVAAQLFVSPRTVDFHLRNCYAKLAVSSRAELTALPLAL